MAIYGTLQTCACFARESPDRLSTSGRLRQGWTAVPVTDAAASTYVRR